MPFIRGHLGPWPLRKSLLRFSRQDIWRLRDVLEGGCLITGQTGAGKTTGRRCNRCKSIA